MTPVEAVQRWVDRIVIGLDLCPFAAGARRGTRVVEAPGSEEDVLSCLIDEGLALLDAPADQAATTLLVLTGCAQEFGDFLDLVETTEAVLEAAGLHADLQIAHFHPDYTFDGEPTGDISHETNRAPHPVLHLLRRDDVARAIASHPDPEGIPQRNIDRLRALGRAALSE